MPTRRDEPEPTKPEAPKPAKPKVDPDPDAAERGYIGQTPEDLDGDDTA